MIVELTHEDLVCLVNGSEASPEIWNYPIVYNNGDNENGLWQWYTGNLEELSKQQLWELYVLCRDKAPVIKSSNMKLDKYHYHEAVDRIDIVRRILDDTCTDHWVASKHKELKKALQRVDEALGEAYNIASELADEFEGESL